MDTVCDLGDFRHGFLAAPLDDKCEHIGCVLEYPCS
jgi:hypothetical protein